MQIANLPEQLKRVTIADMQVGETGITDGAGRRTAVAWIGGKSKRVLMLRRETLKAFAAGIIPEWEWHDNDDPESKPDIKF